MTAASALILHGFTARRKTVAPLVPALEAEGYRCTLPVFSGHGSHWRALRGRTAHHWYEEAEAALAGLVASRGPALLVGHSMGGLLALALAARRPEHVRGVAVLAPALRFRNPLAPLTARLAPLLPVWCGRTQFLDPARRHPDCSYPCFPTRTFASVVALGRAVAAELPAVRAPLRVLASRQDPVVPPAAAHLVHERVGSADRELLWFDRSGHQLLLDGEAEAVVAAVAEFARALTGRPALNRPA